MKRRPFPMFLPLLVAAQAGLAAAQPAPPQPAPASVSVPREVLQRYAGRYELNGTIATVGVTDDGRLTAQLAGQLPGPPLRALSANEFVADAVGVRLSFEGEGPKASRIRSQFAGSEVVGTRIADGAAVQNPPGGLAAASSSILGATDRQEIVARLGEVLRRRYVFPEVGAKMAAKIDAALAAGDYDPLTDPAAFATRLSSDTYAVAHDKHLNIVAMSALPAPRTAGPMPSAEGGVTRADRLAGGVGYIEVIGFPPPSVFKPAVDRAMSSLAGSRALIIDVRRNGGGSPETVAYLSSFLVAPDRPLNDIVSRVENTGDFVRTSYRSVPTPVSFAGVPVYILTSGSTFSGGEGFAYEVQAQKRGTVIGEVTGGGANPIGMVGLAHGFGATIPFARAENPVTKTNWEGRGVQPDVPVAAKDALAVALERAGQKPVAGVDAASRERVFSPRSTPLPGSEAALRAILAGYASGKPGYDAMSPQLAEMTRLQLPQLQAQFAPLGELQSMTFHGPDNLGGDEYELHFAGGDRMMALLLGPAGKVVAVSTAMLLPPRQ